MNEEEEASTINRFSKKVKKNKVTERKKFF